MSNKYFFKNDNGDLLDFASQIVCTFETEDDMKYIVYTDNERSEKNELIVYGATVDNENILTPIKKEEYYLIQDSINMLKEKYGNMNLGGLENE